MKVARRLHVRKQKMGLESQVFRRPANYFAKTESRAEIREDNRLAKASVIRAPRDLE